jgi:hypothetical protein
LRSLAAGTCLLLPLAVMLLAYDVVRTFIFSTHLAISALTEALLHMGDMAALNVIPYLAPVLLALLVDSGLRSLIFSWEVLPAAPGDAPRLHPGRDRSRWPKPAARRAQSRS